MTRHSRNEPPTAPAGLVTGPVFATELRLPGEPVWAPLEAVARLARDSPELPSFHEGEFMFMATVCAGRRHPAIHLYKHIDTRRYLNLDDSGRAYAYRGSVFDEFDESSGGRYQRYRTLRAAVEHLELELFAGDPPLFRSFPPATWPADDAGARPPG